MTLSAKLSILCKTAPKTTKKMMKSPYITKPPNNIRHVFFYKTSFLCFYLFVGGIYARDAEKMGGDVWPFGKNAVILQQVKYNYRSQETQVL